MVNDEELTGTAEYLTLQTRCRINRCRYNRIRPLLPPTVTELNHTYFEAWFRRTYKLFYAMDDTEDILGVLT